MNQGISRLEFKILVVLQKLNTAKVSALALKTDISRTTVSFRLNKLKLRELVERVKVGGHYEWRVTDRFNRLVLKEKSNIGLSVKSYQGSEDFKNVLTDIIKKSSKHKIYLIEPYIQTKEHEAHIDSESLSTLTQLFKECENISEGVSSEKNLELIKEYDKEVLKEMVGRMTVIHFIPDEYISFKEIVVVCDDFVYMIDFTKETVTEIQNKSFAESLISLTQTLQKFGKKIDLNGYIKNLV